MNLATFQTKLIAYVIDEILPNLPEIPISIFGFNIPISPSLMRFGAGVGATMSTLNIERYAPQLKAFGILRDNNTVDIKKLSDSLTQEIGKVGSFKIGDLEFTEEDVVGFVEYLNA